MILGDRQVAVPERSGGVSNIRRWPSGESSGPFLLLTIASVALTVASHKAESAGSRRKRHCMTRGLPR
jgi:hypothetical protein